MKAEKSDTYGERDFSALFIYEHWHCLEREEILVKIMEMNGNMKTLSTWINFHGCAYTCGRHGQQ